MRGFKLFWQIWVFVLIALAVSNGRAEPAVDDSEFGERSELSPLSPSLLELSPYIKQFGTVHIVLSSGEHLFSEVTAVLLSPSKKDSTTPESVTLYLSGGFKIEIGEDSAKVFDRDGNLLMETSKVESKDEKEKSGKDTDEVVRNKPKRSLQALGTVRTVQNSRYRPSPCTFRTGIAGSYNPCNTPAGGFVRNFRMPYPAGETSMIRSGMFY